MIRGGQIRAEWDGQTWAENTVGLVSRDGNIVNWLGVWTTIEDEDFETENEDKIYTTTDDGKLLTYEEIFSNAGSIIQIVENDITEEFYDEKRENL